MNSVNFSDLRGSFTHNLPEYKMRPGNPGEIHSSKIAKTSKKIAKEGPNSCLMPKGKENVEPKSSLIHKSSENNLLLLPVLKIDRQVIHRRKDSPKNMTLDKILGSAFKQIRLNDIEDFSESLFPSVPNIPKNRLKPLYDNTDDHIEIVNREYGLNPFKRIVNKNNLKNEKKNDCGTEDNSDDHFCERIVNRAKQINLKLNTNPNPNPKKNNYITEELEEEIPEDESSNESPIFPSNYYSQPANSSTLTLPDIRSSALEKNNNTFDISHGKEINHPKTVKPHNKAEQYSTSPAVVIFEKCHDLYSSEDPYAKSELDRSYNNSTDVCQSKSKDSNPFKDSSLVNRKQVNLPRVKLRTLTELVCNTQLKTADELRSDSRIKSTDRQFLSKTEKPNKVEHKRRRSVGKTVKLSTLSKKIVSAKVKNQPLSSLIGAKSGNRLCAGNSHSLSKSSIHVEN